VVVVEAAGVGAGAGAEDELRFGLETILVNVETGIFPLEITHTSVKCAEML
jgi:hypothetical protein